MRFIEIVNWRAAQSRMTGDHNPWLKVYTSLLDCDQFRGLDDTARMLIIGLWLYAAYSGRHIFPADAKWIWKRIPMLNSEPDLTPLLEAKDAYGRPKPFVQYCEAPMCDKVDKKGIYNIHNAREKRREEKDQRQRQRQTKPLRASEKKREKKNRVSSKPREEHSAQPEPGESRPAQGTADSQPVAQTPEQGQKPVNPAKSEVGGQGVTGRGIPAALTRGHPSRTVPRPAYHGEPMRMGAVVESIEHWYDADAVQFGYDIFDALQLHKIDHPDSQWGKAERGTFTKWLHRHRRAGDYQAAREHGLHVARNIAKYPNGARKPGAIWLNAVNGKARSPPAVKMV